MISCCKPGSSTPYFAQGGTNIDAVLDWEHKAYDRCGVRKTVNSRHVIEYPKAEKKQDRDADVPLLVVALCDAIEQHKDEVNVMEVEKYLTNHITRKLQRAIMSLDKKAVEKSKIKNTLEKERNPGDLSWCLLVQFLENTNREANDPLFPRRCQSNLLSIWKQYYWHTRPSSSEQLSDDWYLRVNEWFASPRKTMYLKQLIYLMHQVNAESPSKYGTLRRIFKACNVCSKEGTDFENIIRFCEIVSHKLFNADTATDVIAAGSGYGERSLEDTCGWGGQYDQQCAESRRQCFLVCTAHYDAIFDNKAIEDEPGIATSISVSLPLSPDSPFGDAHAALVCPAPCVAATVAVISYWTFQMFGEKNLRTQLVEQSPRKDPTQLGNNSDFLPSESSQQLPSIQEMHKTPSSSAVQPSTSSPSAETPVHVQTHTSNDTTNTTTGQGSGESQANTSGGAAQSRKHLSTRSHLTHSPSPSSVSPGPSKTHGQVRSYQGSKMSDHSHSGVSIAISQDMLDVITDTNVRSRATDATALKNADKIKQLAHYMKKAEERFVDSEKAQQELAEACRELEKRLEGQSEGRKTNPLLGVRQSQLSQHTHQLLDIENEVISLRREKRGLEDEIMQIKREVKKDTIEREKEMREARKETLLLRNGVKAMGVAMEGFQEEMLAMRNVEKVTESDLENAFLREELSRVRHDADIMRSQITELQEVMLKMERNIRTQSTDSLTPNKRVFGIDTYTSSSSSSSPVGFMNIPTSTRLIADDNMLNAKLASLQFHLSS